MMIHVGFSELSRAYREHIATATAGTSSTHYMILFYAVECGIKSIYLTRNRVNTTDKLPSHLSGTHDLDKWIRELRLPAFIANRAKVQFFLERDGTSWSISEAHQVWRYGCKMNSTDEVAFVTWLNKINNWIQQNIR